nr:TniB family NTP-binding protein [Flexivirga meconopsidis]
MFRHVDAVTAWLAGTFIDTPATAAVQASMDMTVRYNSATLPGSKTILAVTGANGAGKSTACHQWSARFYRAQTADLPRAGRLPQWNPHEGVRADVAPVVWINLQANAKIAELDAQILQFLRVGVSGTIRDMTLRAVRAMARHRVKALLIDDVHLLNTRYRNGSDVLDHLKHLNTELGEIGGTLILVGANLEQTALPGDPQIATRLRLLRVQPQPVETAADRTAWAQTLTAVEQAIFPVLPAAVDGVLAEQHAGLLHELTGGYLGELVTLVKHAAIQATGTRVGTITEQILHECPRSVRAVSNLFTRETR